MSKPLLRSQWRNILSVWQDSVPVLFGLPSLFIACAILMTSCSSTGGVRLEDDQRYSEQCKPSPHVALSDVTSRGHRSKAAQNMQVKGFSRESLAFADLLHIGPLIRQIPHTEAEAGTKRVDAALRLIRLQQKVMQKILVASLEVSSASVELRCEQARADRMADEMESNQSRRYTRLTLSSILITALSSIVSGGSILAGEAIAAGVAAVTGGAVWGSLGGLALLDSDERTFHHPRNHLKDIWEGPEQSSLFPQAIWVFLNQRGSAAEEKSLREQLVEDWKGKGRLADHDSEDEGKRIALLFGEGGAYGIKQLRARTDMLGELSTTIDHFYEALERFANEAMKESHDAIE